MDNRTLSLKLFVVLSKAYKVIMDQAVRDMKKHGLSESEFTVMELLYHKGNFPLQRIGEKMLITSGGITYTIDKLEKKGYIRRITWHEDRRVTFAEITEQGKAVMERIFPHHADKIESIMQGLTVGEKEAAIELMKKLGLKAQQVKG